jgi:TolB-like protein
LALSAQAAPAGQAAPGSAKAGLIVLDLSAGGGVDAVVAQSLSEALAVEASKAGYFQVMAQKEVSTLLGLERQKQLLGCNDGASTCQTELAGALGARFVLSGSVTKLGGDTFQLNLQTQDTAKTTTLGRATRIAKDLPSLRGLIPWLLAEATATPSPPEPSLALPITFIGAGGAVVVGGGVFLLQSLTREEVVLNDFAEAAKSDNFPLKSADYYRGEAAGISQQRLIGGILAGVGAAALVAGIVLMPSSSSGARVAVVPTGNGAALVGVLP